jgi:hypothetical protein
MPRPERPRRLDLVETQDQREKEDKWTGATPTSKAVLIMKPASTKCKERL